MTLREIWRRITTTRYTRMLREELAHAHAENVLLRAENRALLNSILGIAGVPPLQIAEADLVAARSRDTMRDAKTAHAVPGQSEAPARAADLGRAPGARLAAPMRRRSWQQINRMLEFESAKKKSPDAI